MLIATDISSSTRAIEITFCFDAISLVQDGFASPCKGQGCLMAIESFTVKDVHPANSFGFADLSQMDLGRLQILMSQDDLGNDLERHPVAAGEGS